MKKIGVIMFDATYTNPPLNFDVLNMYWIENDAIMRDAYTQHIVSWQQYEFIFIENYTGDSDSTVCMENFIRCIVCIIDAGVRVIIISNCVHEIMYIFNFIKYNPIKFEYHQYKNINPFDIDIHASTEIFYNNWGTLKIYKKEDNEIIGAIGPRVSWTHINLIDCIELTKFIPTMQINKNNMHFVGEDKMPLFRAFLLCLKRMPKLPQPIKWIILNLWYFW